MRDPRVQAAYMKDVAASLSRLGSVGAAIRAADGELFAEIEAASRGAWLPVSMNVRWVEAAGRTLGWPDAMGFLAARVHEQLGTPLFRSFVQGGVTLFGLDPGSLVRLIPRGLALVFRDCGDWTAVRTSATSVELRGSGLPEPLASHARWVESVGGGALAMFTLCRVTGSAQLAEHRPERGSAVIEARWRKAERG